MHRIKVTLSIPSYLFLIVLLLALSMISVPALAADTDGDGIDDTIEQSTGTDYQSSDTDMDGIGDGVEDANKNGTMNAGETNPRDADTDDDALRDGQEDLNGNGVVNAGETDPRDNDSDNDFLNDGLEKGRTSGIPAGTSFPNNRPYMGTTGWTADADPSTTTNPLNPDSDGDAWLDGNEDANRNGRVDAGETNPNLSDDADHDGHYAMSSGGDDCNDGDDSIYPGAVEIIGDGVDQDCDGHETCYCDADNDSYRPDETSTVLSDDLDCNDSGEALESDQAGDCDDTVTSVNPGTAEIWYDGTDQDCDGWNDFDMDQDGYVSADYPGQSGGTSPHEDDCDDTDDSIHPGAAEIPNDGIDQDCDGFDQTLCNYTLPGDWDGNCKVDLTDLAILAANWLVDCLVEPVDPACVPLP